MVTVYLASILAGVFYGITESVNKYITEKKYSAFSYAFIQFGINLIVYSLLFPLIRQIPGSPTPYIYLSISALLVVIGNILIIKSYKTEDISNLNILTKSSLIIAFLIGVVILKESVSILNVLAIILILLGVIIIFFEKRTIKLSPGYLTALLSGICYGVQTFFLKKSSSYFHPISFYFFFYIFTVIFMLFIPGASKDIKPIFEKYKHLIIPSRIALVIANLLFIWSIANGKIAIVNANAETTLLLSILFIGILFLGEKNNIGKKVAGSLLCIVGIILLNFF
ncbi:hypothetical protein A2Y99_03210 [Candidatus Gottesmanbacteria bacterium RBG_13_37_7]|uniref:EamA domain-containing protein n=1 Tax=Candidatus Gottesmanbacteria bacterium RBG_13_37_7 TaxID=1798369 RepID=A0A1F5YGJ3_9BACT|nr:MAG: hypothetical protein A2Y99_03210 [Candidatus Gottesmanbacteria bacterium RBG_13_37_7]